MTAATVRALIERAAAERPDAVYAIATEREASLAYGGLLASCRRIAALLDAHGAAPGDTVSIVMPNGLATLRWFGLTDDGRLAVGAVQPQRLYDALATR